MQLVASDKIFSWTVIREVSLTRLLARGAADLRAERLSLWVQIVSPMWRMFQRNWSAYGIDTVLGRTSERNTRLGADWWEPGQKEIHNRRHSVSVASPVDVAEATLVKQAGLQYKSSLMRTKPERDPKQMAQCVCGIPYGCGRSYIGETGWPLV
jgi:hypothetical protein